MPSHSQEQGTTRLKSPFETSACSPPPHSSFQPWQSHGRNTSLQKSGDASTATLHQRMSGHEREGGGGGRGRDKFCDSFPHRVIQNKMLCNYASLMETPSLFSPPKERLSHAWVPASPRSPVPGAACVSVPSPDLYID